jgi:hypothetical protein
MLLLVFVVIFALMSLGLATRDVYLYTNRADEKTVGRVTFYSAISYLILAVLLFITAFGMLVNNKVQYTVNFNRLVRA